jgi:DNA-binding winged helix-turn-helix (wHTH) protein
VTQPPSSIQFGAFDLDLETGELRRGGAPVALRPQAMALLLLLARNRGRLVSRDEIRRALWSDTVVEFDQGINACVRQIRRALDDDPARPSYVETVPRRGYRFSAPVHEAPPLPPSPAAPPTAAPAAPPAVSPAAPPAAPSEAPPEALPTRPGLARGRARRVAAAALAVVVVATAAWALLGRGAAAQRTILIAPVGHFLDEEMASYPDQLSERMASAVAGVGGSGVRPVQMNWSLRWNADQGLLENPAGGETRIDFVAWATVGQLAGQVRVEVFVRRIGNAMPLWQRTYEFPRADRASHAERIAEDLAAALRQTLAEGR